MKIKIKIFFFLAFLGPFPGLSQDWQCVREGVTATFVDTMKYFNNYRPYNSMWAVNVDSVESKAGWTYYYGYVHPRLVSSGYISGTSKYAYCYDAFAPSRMGISFSAKDGENFFFNSGGNGVRISTLRKIGESWICCKINDTSNLYATVAFNGIENVLGQADSVKTIFFQAKRLNGEFVNHPMNNNQFKLSKHFGMITLYDFYEFPQYSIDYPLYSPVHILAGLKSSFYNVGEKSLTYKDIFTFTPGDIFHTIEGGSNSHYILPSKKTISIILDAVWNKENDTVTYKICNLIDYYNGWSDSKHIYYRETIFKSYGINSNDCMGFNSLPEQTTICYNSSGTIKSVNSFVQAFSKDYNSRWIKMQGKKSTPDSYCADTLVQRDQNGFNYFYIEGCGGPYYELGGYVDHDIYNRSYYRLVYFKKGTEIWGDPIDTSKWPLPEKEPIRIILYPNPSSSQLTIAMPDSLEGKKKLEIYNIAGVKTDEILFEATKFSFNISNYPNGMYFIKIYKENLLLDKQKFIKTKLF